MKNYVKEGQKLPMFGIGPYLVGGMGLVTVIGIFLSGNVLKSGILDGIWTILFRVIGIIMIITGIAVWYIGSLKSDMDASITDNRLQTGGIYAWVRNPMYSGCWGVMIGVSLMCHNVWAVMIQIINWGIMTVVLMSTEEKWLANLYGKEYDEYKSRVNRCIPWIPRKNVE